MNKNATALHESVPAEGLPLVSVIVVNYNGAAHLNDCLGSLRASTYPHLEVIVVDNASLDESKTLLKAYASCDPSLIVLLNDENLGYAAGVNRALEVAQGSFIAVLNMDLTVSPHWLEPLIRFLKNHEQVAAVCPLVKLTDQNRINAVGQDIHVTGLGFNRGLGMPAEKAAITPMQVSGIQGAAFVVSRLLLDKTRGLDASGFLYHEDVNISWLIHLMDRRIFCVPESVVFHDYFLSMYPAKLYLLERNRWAMLRAYLHPSTLVFMSPLLLLTELLLWAYCVLQGWTFMRAKWKSYRWLWRQRGEINDRRRWVESVRVVSDWHVLKRLCWAYRAKQFLTLGRERGAFRRHPAGGVPEEMMNR